MEFTVLAGRHLVTAFKHTDKGFRIFISQFIADISDVHLRVEEMVFPLLKPDVFQKFGKGKTGSLFDQTRAVGKGKMKMPGKLIKGQRVVILVNIIKKFCLTGGVFSLHFGDFQMLFMKADQLDKKDSENATNDAIRIFIPFFCS